MDAVVHFLVSLLRSVLRVCILILILGSARWVHPEKNSWAWPQVASGRPAAAGRPAAPASQLPSADLRRCTMGSQRL